MCEAKVCSANRKLIFGFIFGLATSDATMVKRLVDVQEDFGGNPVTLQSQRDKVALARKNVFFTLACFARQCGAGLMINEAAAELFYTRETRVKSGAGNGKGTEEKDIR